MITVCCEMSALAQLIPVRPASPRENPAHTLPLLILASKRKDACKCAVVFSCSSSYVFALFAPYFAYVLL